MPSPEQERLESLTESIVELLRRQNEFEKRLALLEGQNVAQKTTPQVQQPVGREVPRNPPANPPVYQSVSPVSPSFAREKSDPAARPKNVALETKVGLTVINRIGVITLVLGVAFFFKWAVDNNWIGPAGRVLLGILAGSATLWAGDVLWRKAQRAFAQGITGTGIAVLYLSFYSAFGFYHLIPQVLAFPLMCSVTGLAFALSLRYDSPAVTALGLLGGYLTPILLSTGEDHPWFLFSYIFLLDAATLALAKKRNWRLLELMSVVATVLIYGAWLIKVPRHTDRLPATAFLFAFYALFSWSLEPALYVSLHALAALAIVNIGQESPALFFPLALLLAAGGLVYAERRPFLYMLYGAFGSFWLSYALFALSNSPAGVLPEFLGITAAFLVFFLWNVWRLAGKQQMPGAQRLSVVALNGIVYYAAAYQILHVPHHNYLGLLAVAVAGAYLSFGAFLYRTRSAAEQDLRPILLSLGMALAFATLAIPIQFTGFTITIAWSLEAAVLSWIGLRLHNSRAVVGGMVVFALVAFRLLSFDSTMLPDARTYSLLWNQRFVTFAVASISFFLAAWWTSQTSRSIALWEYLAGHIILLSALSLELIAWAERSMPPENVLSTQTVSISVLFGVYALVLVSVGVATRTAVNRIAGLVLIGLVIVKLYLFDVWQLQRPYRISAFIALGVLLISTSFLYSRFRPLIESLLKDDETAS